MQIKMKKYLREMELLRRLDARICVPLALKKEKTSMKVRSTTSVDYFERSLSYLIFAPLFYGHY